jgi:hypothetical protein
MRGLQCGDPIQIADGIAILIGNDAVAPLACEEFTRLRAEIAARRQNRDNAKNDCRDNVLRTRARAHALNHGDAID